MASLYAATVIEAAGGVVERHTAAGCHIAVICRTRYGVEWGLPKGKRQAGETWQQVALREVEEETGLRPEIIGVAGATAYLAGGTPKLVLYWHTPPTWKTSCARRKPKPCSPPPIRQP